MTILRSPMCGLLLGAIVLWPPSANGFSPEDYNVAARPSPSPNIPAIPDMKNDFSVYEQPCRDDMGKLYKQVEALESLDNLNNDVKKASVSGKAQEFINKSLPKFKEKCGPLAATSVRDLENGIYLRVLAAAREKRKKAFRHIKAAGHVSDSELMEDLSLQQ